MSLETNLAGRLRNTSLPLSAGLMPLFEAVVNSIHAVEDKDLPSELGHVRIEILRKEKTKKLALNDSKNRGPDAKGEILGFKVTDNGIGFDDTNMKSFHTLDSDHKISRGGRGVGRLLWLKAFRSVKIDSVYKCVTGKHRRRRFEFDSRVGVSGEQIDDADTTVETGSTIILDDFLPTYRDKTKKTGKAISEAILDHCLWYFLRPGGVPNISIEDQAETYSLNDTFADHMHTSAVRECIEIKGQKFDLLHAKLRSNSLATHTMALCADQRLVSEEKLSGKISGLHGRLADENGEFVYSCFVSSTFLDKCARPERTGFNTMENVEGLFENLEITLSNIEDEVIKCASSFLAEHLTANLERSKERISRFVATRAPRYRPILSRIPEEELNVDPDVSDKELDLTLHKHFASLESELLAEGHDIMAASPGDDFLDYEARLREYLRKAEDIKKSDLASYVSHRRVILDLFEKSIKRDEKGNYVREELIHQLIMPMRMDSENLPLNAGNLWLVDERLAFHDYLASDKTIQSFPITDAGDTKEPDICVLNVYDQPILFSESTKLPPASLEIIELKRPLRNDAATGEEKDPIEQALGYLERIRTGGVRTATGRIIPESQNTPGFCYVIADLTPTLIARCKMHDLTRTADGMGYFGYKKNSQAYIEVIGFDRLLNMAKERNRAFFDKLGLPSN